MQMIKKILSLSLLSLTLSIAQAKLDPVEIWVNSATDDAYYRNMIKIYQETVDKDFAATVHSYGFTEMPDKLAIAIKTGINAPDLVQLDEIYFSIYLNGSAMPFADLTKKIEAAGFNQTVMPQRMGLFSYKGKTYGLPQSIANVVLYYRDDIFKDLGITPASIDTWDKFIAVSKKIHTESRSMLALDWSLFEILLRQRGFDIFDEKGNPQLLSEASIETMKFLVSLKNDSVGMVPDRGSIFEPEFFNSYVANNGVVSIIGADWYGLDMLQGFSPKLAGKWRAMPLPVWTDTKSKGKNTTSNFSGQGFVIMQKSKQQERAWKFMSWTMSNTEANVQRYLQGNCLTPYKPAWLDMRLSRPEPYFGGQSVASLLIEQAPKSPMVVQSPYRAKFVNLLRENYWQALIKGGANIEESLQIIQSELTKPAASKPASTKSKKPAPTK